jgi:hypothetical protein
MGKSEVRFLNLPEARQSCNHSALNLIAARNEWGEPQLWCRCGHVIECPPARLWDESGKVEAGGNLKLWNNLAAQEIARRIQAGRR